VFWYYRKQLTKSVHNFFVQGMAHSLAPHLVVHTRLVVLVLLESGQQLHHWKVFGREIGGTFTIDVGGLLIVSF